MGLRAAAGNSRLAAAQHVSSSNYRHYTVYCVTRRGQMGLGAAAGYSRLAAATIANVLCHKT